MAFWVRSHLHIVLSKSHENPSKYVDTVNFTFTIWVSDLKWPLNGLMSWGHIFAHTSLSFCQSPMKIHQSMWIQWPTDQLCISWSDHLLSTTSNDRYRWPCDSIFVWLHIYWGLMYPNIILPKCHEIAKKVEQEKKNGRWNRRKKKC